MIRIGNKVITAIEQIGENNCPDFKVQLKSLDDKSNFEKIVDAVKVGDCYIISQDNLLTITNKVDNTTEIYELNFDGVPTKLEQAITFLD